MIRLRPSGADEVLIKRVRDWYEPGPGVFIQSMTVAFSPAMLFTGSTTGAWYDPSDLTTLFQNAAGTTPVTAVEQPVGLMLDKSGRNNHAFNSSGNSANFPVLSARYNLLTKSEDFSDAVWTKNQATVSAATAPNGTLTATKLTSTGTATYAFQTATGLLNSPYTFSISVSKGTSFTIAVDNGNNTGRGVTFDGLTGAFVTFNTFGAGYAVSAYSCVTHPLNSNYWLASITITPNAGANAVSVWINTAKTSNYASGISTAGDTLTVWGADLRVSNDALNQPTYQRVNTATDYDTVGFKPYLRFNGVNQWLQTNSIDFTYGDKMFVCAGVRKLTDGSSGAIVETSTGGGAGSFLLNAPSVTGQNNYQAVLYGSAQTAIKTAATYSAPITNVLSYSFDRAGADYTSEITAKVNGATPATQAGSGSVTGNFGNYPLYIGARAGTSLWFNGRLYGMVVASKQASDSEITNTETYLNQKTGAY